MTEPNSLPYTTGSETSKQAAQDALASVSHQRAKIWTALNSRGPMMYEDICNNTGFPVQSVTTRLTQMRDAGMIAHETKEVENELGRHLTIVTRQTSTGSFAAVYRALDPPWTEVPRTHRGVTDPKLREVVRTAIACTESKDFAGLIAAVELMKELI